MANYAYPGWPRCEVHGRVLVGGVCQQCRQEHRDAARVYEGLGWPRCPKHGTVLVGGICHQCGKPVPYVPAPMPSADSGLALDAAARLCDVAVPSMPPQQAQVVLQPSGPSKVPRWARSLGWLLGAYVLPAAAPVVGLLLGGSLVLAWSSQALCALRRDVG